jgi:GNAT superfamily N-acetyltransferase
VVLSVREIASIETHDLRSRVLRGGGGHDGFPEDNLPGTFHVGAFDADTLVGVATFVPHEEGVWQLRGMAVEPDRQGQGIGQAVLDYAVTKLRASGAQLAWANGRDTALAFYQRAGWTVVGEGYVLPVGDEGGMAHHRVELYL